MMMQLFGAMMMMHFLVHFWICHVGANKLQVICVSGGLLGASCCSPVHLKALSLRNDGPLKSE